MQHDDPWNPERLQHALNRPRPPAALAQRLHADIDRQAAQEDSRGRRRIGAFAVAATALIATLLLPLRPLPSSPPFVRHAVQHAGEERGLHGVLDGEFERWRTQAGIAMPGDGVQLRLAKHCQVDNHAVRHLRLASPATGEVEVLIGTQQIAAWPRPGTGEDGDQRRWLSLKPRAGLSLLVLYGPHVSDQAVRHLVQSLIQAPDPRPAVSLASAHGHPTPHRLTEETS